MSRFRGRANNSSMARARSSTAPTQKRRWRSAGPPVPPRSRWCRVPAARPTIRIAPHRMSPSRISASRATACRMRVSRPFSASTWRRRWRRTRSPRWARDAGSWSCRGRARDAPGRLILNPSDQDIADFIMLPTIARFREQRGGGLHDAVRGCIRNQATKERVCGPLTMDTGAPGIEVRNPGLGHGPGPMARPRYSHCSTMQGPAPRCR